MVKLTKVEQNIIKELEEKFTIDNPPEITQERFDLIVDKLIVEDKKEVMWNLCVTYSIDYEGKYYYNKIVDYYIKTKDSYYLEELICFACEELDHKYIVEEMLKTEDKTFIKNTLLECGKAVEHCLKPIELEKLLDYLKEKETKKTTYTTIKVCKLF